MKNDTKRIKQQTKGIIKQNRKAWTMISLPMIVLNLVSTFATIYVLLITMYNVFAQLVLGTATISSLLGAVSSIAGVYLFTHLLGYVRIVIDILQAPVAYRLLEGEDVGLSDLYQGEQDWSYTFKLALSMWLSGSFLPKLIPGIGGIVSVGVQLFYISIPYMRSLLDPDSVMATLKNNVGIGKVYLGSYLKLVYLEFILDWMLLGFTSGLTGFLLYPKLLVAKCILFKELAESLDDDSTELHLKTENEG